MERKPDKRQRYTGFVCVRRRNNVQSKDPGALDVFTRCVSGCDFKVIITNTRIGAEKLLASHSRRGAREGMSAELKSDSHRGYVPTSPQGKPALTLRAKTAVRNVPLHYPSKLDNAEEVPISV